MIARLAVTAIMLLLAVAAYFSPSGCDNCQQHLGAPFGIFFAVIAGIIWLGWESFREWFDAAKNESQLPIIRLGSMALGGLALLVRRGPRQRRSSSDSAT
jgi:hypothetical protein